MIKRLVKEDYKGSFKNTNIEILNVDYRYGKMIADELAFKIKDRIETYTHLKVKNIIIECS